MILKNPYISIHKLKSSVVDLSVVAVNCAVLDTWDYRAAIGIIDGILTHGACDYKKFFTKSSSGQSQ